MKKRDKLIYFGFCFLLLVINLVQALFTNLSYDEAYYWMYSQHLDWGYFDHPPLVALFIKLGYSLFNNELGLRLAGALSNFFILFLIPKIMNIEDLRGKFVVLFVCASLPLFQLLGFISLPDSPLLFFTCLYFYFLKQFYDQQSYKMAIMLGATMALMAYSKYHAFLLVFLTVLSNWRLVKNQLFILALATAILLFMPHIIWQINNGFVSFKYHLSERHLGFEWYHLPEYIFNVLLIFNPFLLIFMYRSLRNENLETDFDRTLRFVIIGTLAFFFGCNYLGHVQPQWLVICVIPSAVLMVGYFKKNELKIKSLKRVFWLSSGLFLVIRSALIFDISPGELEFHESIDRVAGIIRKSGAYQVVFQGNYRLASVYAFQTRNNNVHTFGGKSAFNQWHNAVFYMNKPVMVVGADMENSDTILLKNGQVETVAFVEHFKDRDI